MCKHFLIKNINEIHSGRKSRLNKANFLLFIDKIKLHKLFYEIEKAGKVPAADETVEKRRFLTLSTKRKLSDSFRDAFWFAGITELEEKTEASPLISQTSVRCLCAYLPASLGFALECPWIIIREHDRSPVNQTRRRLPSSFRFIADLTWRRLCSWWYIDPFRDVRCKG